MSEPSRYYEDRSQRDHIKEIPTPIPFQYNRKNYTMPKGKFTCMNFGKNQKFRGFLQEKKRIFPVAGKNALVFVIFPQEVVIGVYKISLFFCGKTS